MLEYQSSDPPCSAQAQQAAHPQARLMLGALEDCCHPRAARLRARLLDCRDAQGLAWLRQEVRYLLALSFGRDEAELRLGNFE